MKTIKFNVIQLTNENLTNGILDVNTNLFDPNAFNESGVYEYNNYIYFVNKSGGSAISLYNVDVNALSSTEDIIEPPELLEELKAVPVTFESITGDTLLRAIAIAKNPMLAKELLKK